MHTASRVCAVANIRAVTADGLYAPHAVESDATMMVDVVLVSSYSSAVHPRLDHVMLAPLRYLFDSVVDATKVRFVTYRVLREGADRMAALLPSGAGRH